MRIKPEIITALREWAAFEQDGGNVEQGAAIDIILDWYDRQQQIVNAADLIPYDPQGPEVTVLHHWFADNYSAANWVDDGCRSENARDLLNTLAKAGFIVIPKPAASP